MSDSLRPHGPYSPRNSPGQNTGVGSLSLLQQIFLTQESNQGLLHCRQTLYQLSYQRSPRKISNNLILYLKNHKMNQLSVCVLCFSCVRLFATPWTVAPQAPLSMGILQARILDWVATPSSRGFSQPRE